MSVMPRKGRINRNFLFGLIFWLILQFVISGVYAYTDDTYSVPESGVYFNFNEGSGNNTYDISGNGNAGALHDVSRVENGGCGKAVFFNGNDSYGEIPFNSQNHPTQEITVSLFFYTASYGPQVLISSYENGGYRLGFDDGNDLWWTINLEKRGDVSIPIRHEGISSNQWHQVTGTYNGETLKVYLDGVLRNQVNATGAIHYDYNNYIILGADAGIYDLPDKNCPQYFLGGLDEVRIYPVALTYGEVMEDRFSCSQELSAPSMGVLVRTQRLAPCSVSSGSVVIGPGEPASRILTFSNQTENGIWNVTLPPGSTLVVRAKDLYSISYPDTWYVELSDENGRITRSIAFPNTHNAPITGIVPSGNATVLVRYFDGMERFPATVAIQFESIAPLPPPTPPEMILNYPIIVIYSASWATLIAIVLVIVWLHRRKNKIK